MSGEDGAPTFLVADALAVTTPDESSEHAVTQNRAAVQGCLPTGSGAIASEENAHV